MSVSDPATQSLMAPGGPFEVANAEVGGQSVRVFKHAPETLIDIIDGARAHGQAEFIAAGDKRLTYDDFFAAADFLASSLVNDHGVLPGQSVAICMKNSPEWMIGFVAILQAGGVAVLVNSRGTAKTMLQAVHDTDCVLALTDRRRHALLLEQGCRAALVDLQDAAFGQLDSAWKNVPRKADDLAAMFFTSGTTGSAKAAAMSNRALVTGTMNTQMAMTAIFLKMAAAYKIDLETLRAQLPQSCALLIFPLFHTSGCSAVFLTTLINGGKLAIMNRWDPDEAIHLIEQERITILGGVPATHWDILNSGIIDEHDLSSLMSISNGGQAFPRNLMAALQARFPRAFIGAGYGMTETSGSVSQANGEALLAKPQASGTILPMVDVQITSDQGEPLLAGQTGEIWVKGATLMTEYYGRPEDTRAVFSGEWFKTGDIGYVDDEGYIYIVDRKTDMVISGGENIYCVEVEAALSQHPDVFQVCTFGVPDDRLGERLIACYVAAEGDVEPEALEGFAKDTLAAYRVPKMFVQSKTPFALNAMGKIEKRAVRESFLAGQYS